jgi:glucosamine--fructose-6-phosphate aminotransferase (isomerizing)
LTKVLYEKLEGTYLRDILDQPQALRNTIASFAHVAALDAVRANLRAGRWRRTVLTGMGGSFQVLHPLHLRLLGAGFDSIMAETSELLYTMPSLLGSENVVIAVSQSGASAETVRMLERAEPLYIGVTNTPASPLAQAAEICIETHAGEEGGVSCKTAVTSMAALHWVAEHFMARDLSKARGDLEELATAVETYLAGWKTHVADLADALDGCKHLFLAGRGSSLAAVGLGGMIQKEAAHFHAEGMSSAALRHGPFEMLGPDCYVLVFEGGGNVRNLNRRLVEDVIKTGARAALCGPTAPEGPFRLPETPDSVAPILELIPPQMVSLALAYHQGREPGKFEQITKVTTVE